VPQKELDLFQLAAGGAAQLLPVNAVGGPAPNPCGERPIAGRSGRASR